MAYPETLIRRRPRRTLDHLFGDDVDVAELAGITRPRTVTRPDAEFDPWVGARSPTPIAGDSAASIVTALPRVRTQTFDPQLIPPPQPPPVEEEPPVPLNYRPQQPRDYLADDYERLRNLEMAPVKRSRLKSIGIGLLRGGIPGAITGAIQPEIYGEMKRDQELGRVRKRIEEETVQQRGQLQEDLIQSQILKNTAQAERQSRPPAPVEYTLGPDDVRYQGSREIARGITRPVKPTAPDVRSGNAPVIERQSDGTYKTVYTPPEKPKPSDFNGPLAAVKFKEASKHWARAIELENEAKAIVVVVPDGRGGQVIDPAAEARQEQLLLEARGLKNRTLDLQEKGNELEAKSSRPSRPSGQNPQIKSYADKFFGGDYAKANEAIRKQRGQ